MKKRINVAAAMLALEVGLLKFEKDLEENFEKWPDDPNGIVINYEDFKAAYLKLVAYGNTLIDELVGQLPEVEIPEDPEPVTPEPEELPYETKFHHTMTDPEFKGDGGTSLVSCPGQHWDFIDVRCNGIKLRRHGSGRDEDDRESYWNMFKAPVGDIFATDPDGNIRRYKTVYGKVHKGSCK